MCAALLRIDPLNAENYNSWKLQMRDILIKNDLWPYVDGSNICPENATERAKWKVFDEKACADLTLSISTSELGSSITLQDVLYVKGLKTYLLSVSKITEKGFEVRFRNNKASIFDLTENKEIYVAQRFGNLYYLREHESAANTTEKAQPADKSAINICSEFDLLHQKLGHLNEADMKYLISNELVHSLKVNKVRNLTTCKICLTPYSDEQHFSYFSALSPFPLK